MHPIPIPTLAVVLDEIHTRPDTRALLAAIRERTLRLPEREPVEEPDEPPRPLTVADRLERAHQLLAENPLLSYSAIADRCGLIPQQVRNLAFRYGLQRGARGVHTGRTKSLAVRGAEIRAERTEAVPDRWCLNPRCRKLLVRKPRQKLWRFEEAVVCDHACQHAWLVWKCQARTAIEDRGFRTLAGEPERWFLAEELAQLADIPTNAMHHRLRRWSRKWGWVEIRHLPGDRRPWWRITAAGLEGVREARK